MVSHKGAWLDTKTQKYGVLYTPPTDIARKTPMTHPIPPSDAFQQSVQAHQQDYQEKKQILEHALAFIAQRGWTLEALEEGAAKLELGPDAVWCLFPGGVQDAIAFYSEQLDLQTAEKMETMPLESMGVTEKITWGVRTRLSCMGEHKAVARKTAQFLMQPTHLLLGKRLLWQTVHKLWVLAGDRSTDYNFYTKRLLLSGVYASTVVFWLQDTSEHHQRTWAFLDRCIQQVLAIQKLKPYCKAPFQKTVQMAKTVAQSLKRYF